MEVVAGVTVVASQGTGAVDVLNGGESSVAAVEPLKADALEVSMVRAALDLLSVRVMSRRLGSQGEGAAILVAQGREFWCCKKGILVLWTRRV